MGTGIRIRVSSIVGGVCGVALGCKGVLQDFLS